MSPAPHANAEQDLLGIPGQEASARLEQGM